MLLNLNIKYELWDGHLKRKFKNFHSFSIAARSLGQIFFFQSKTYTKKTPANFFVSKSNHLLFAKIAYLLGLNSGMCQSSPKRF